MNHARGPLLILAILLLAAPGNASFAGAQGTPVTSGVPDTADAADWWDGGVCYEVFVRSFFDSDADGIGDLQGLIQKLDYLNDGDPATTSDLGVSCLWLMPLFASPSYHGYDVVDYYTIDPDYGTADDFRQLIAAAHERGIRILLDLVLNHTSNEHPWFQSALHDPGSPYRDWYIWADESPGYLGPWGQGVWHPAPESDAYYYGIFVDTMPDLNYRNPGVTAEADSVSRFWLQEMGADGFRLDAIRHLIEDGTIQENSPETHAWLRRYHDELAAIAPGTFTVGEIGGASAPSLQPYAQGQLTSYFDFEIAANLLLAANTGDSAAFAVSAQEAALDLPDGGWAPFITNHDQTRAMTVLGGDAGRARIAATALLTLPGTPFIYYGEEIGMSGDKPDERLRTPMPWTGDETGGFTTGTPWEALQPDLPAVNVAALDADPASLLNHYRRLISLRNTHPALAQGDLSLVDAGNRGIAAYLRQTDNEAALVLLNFSSSPVANPALTAYASHLKEGSYRMTPLLSAEPAADLDIGRGGTFTGYTPLPTLEAQTGYVFVLEPMA